MILFSIMFSTPSIIWLIGAMFVTGAWAGSAREHGERGTIFLIKVVCVFIIYTMSWPIFLGKWTLAVVDKYMDS